MKKEISMYEVLYNENMCISRILATGNKIVLSRATNIYHKPNNKTEN